MSPDNENNIFNEEVDDFMENETYVTYQEYALYNDTFNFGNFSNISNTSYGYAQDAAWDMQIESNSFRYWLPAALLAATVSSAAVYAWYSQ